MNLLSLLSTLQEYHRLGIPEQIDYKKFYLYSIITHSTAIEGIIPQMSPKTVQNVTHNNINVPSTENALLTPRQQQILQMMQTDTSVSASTMATRLDVTVRTIRRDIEALRKHYDICWLGSSKQGHWQILPQSVEQ